MSRRRPSRPLPRTGFTLVEVVFAISLLALIMSLAYGMLTQIMRSKKMLDDGRDSSIAASAILNRLNRELQAYAGGSGAGGSSSDPSKPVLWCGGEAPAGYSKNTCLVGQQKKLGSREADRITFVAAEAGQYVPGSRMHSGTVQITYRVEHDPERARGEEESYYLVRDEIPYIEPADKACERIMTFPVAKNIVSLAISYYNSDLQKWVGEWGHADSGTGLPQIIKISLKIRSPQGRIESYTTAVAPRAR